MQKQAPFQLVFGRPAGRLVGCFSLLCVLNKESAVEVDKKEGEAELFRFRFFWLEFVSCSGSRLLIQSGEKYLGHG
jgi:hypothetical protein